MFESSVIVAAHPDDEVLWFSSVLSRAERVVLCFGPVPSDPAMGEARVASLGEHPAADRITSLGIEESEAFWGVDWDDARETEFGLAVNREGWSDGAYRRNYELLLAGLREALAGARSVFTHGPWGEYGHPEHVQVFRAVRALQSELGFELWVPGYFSNRSAALMARSTAVLDGKQVTLPTNAELARQAAEVYRRHACWTWYDDYRWPESETFLLCAPEGQGGLKAGSLVGLNMVAVDPARRRAPGGRRVSPLRRGLGKAATALGIRSRKD